MPFPNQQPQGQGPKSPSPAAPPPGSKPPGQFPPGKPGMQGPPGAPPATPAPPKLKPGDWVCDPIGLGRDVVLKVEEVAGPVTYVIGDVYESAIPYPTADLQKLEVSDKTAQKTTQVVKAIAEKLMGDPDGQDPSERANRVELAKAALKRLAPIALASQSVEIALTYAVGKNMIALLK